MATWEDGPEYAPLERPQYFADAPMPPLEQAPPPERPADGMPAVRPRFDEPSAPVAPLATLVPTPPDERDPSRPFDVVTATLTSESSWGSPTQPLGSTGLAADQGPATALAPVAPTRAPQPVSGAPWPLTDPAPGQPPVPPDAQGPGGPVGPGVPVGPPPATQPSPFPHAQQQGPYPYPAPGTPAWFTPPPAAYGDQRQPGRPSGREVFEAATPGLCICLAVGGLIYPLAPVMVVVAVFLSMRVQVAQAAVRMTLRIAAGAVAFFAVVGLVRSVAVGDPWWGFVSSWSVAVCWVSLVVVLLVVWQALKRPSTPPPTPWG